MRITPELRAQLVAEAAKNGRSITQEAELRLETSFARQQMLPEITTGIFGSGLAGLLLLAGRVMRDAGSSINWRQPTPAAHWLLSPDAYDAAVAAANRVFEEFRPPGSITGAGPGTGRRFASDRIFNVINQGMPYPFGEKEWIDQVRAALGDLLEQSKTLREEAESDVAIDRARALEETKP
jgi:hypothetical protein